MFVHEPGTWRHCADLALITYRKAPEMFGLDKPTITSSMCNCKGASTLVFLFLFGVSMTLTCAESSWNHPSAWHGCSHTCNLSAGVEQSRWGSRTCISRHQTCWLHTWHLKVKWLQNLMWDYRKLQGIYKAQHNIRVVSCLITTARLKPVKCQSYH